MGAYFVFRTKKESHERFLGQSSDGEIFSIPYDDEIPEKKIEEQAVPQSVLRRARDFMSQLGEKEVEGNA